MKGKILSQSNELRTENVQLTSDLRYTDAHPKGSTEFRDMTLDLYEYQRSEFSTKSENVPLRDHIPASATLE